MINSCLDVHSGRLCLCGTSLILAGLLLVLLGGCRPTEKSASSVETRPSINVSVAPGGSIVITTQAAEFDILPSGDLKAFLLRDGSRATLDDVNMDPVASESLVEVGSKQRNDFRLDFSHVSINDATSIGGARGKRVEITGKSASLPELQTTLSVEAYEDLPNVAVTGVSFKNTGASQLVLGKLVTQSHVLNASGGDANIPPYGMWSFHGSSEAWGKDDVVPITKNFIRHNPMQVVMKEDENRTGGGLPIVALWTKATGLAIGSAEKVPLPLGIPVYTAEDGRVHASVVIDAQARLKPGEVYSAPLTFVAAFQGDFYEPLSFYSKLLQQRGWSLAKQTDADYQANWCGWGYGMDFTPQQMVGTIPKLKELGLKWATLDARWFDARGDWEPRKDTLPGDSLQRIVRAFHDAGLKLTVWWIPIIAEDGHGKDILDHRPYTVSDVVKAHPDWLILNQQGKPARAAADMAALCPALPEVQEYTRQVTKRLIGEWDFDGSKLDFSYTVPPCFNPKHHHKSPNDSIAALGDVYRIVLETTRSLKPQSVTQACPCGTPPNLAWLPFIDQAVTADPVGSKQVRERIKMYKGLLGPNAAIYGDHVELTEMHFGKTLEGIDLGQDFASEVGAGAVLGTKFTWPDYGPKWKKVELTAQKEARWNKWIDIYNSKMLSKGTFLNLYTYGYDFPEAYAIEKDGSMFYAFYAGDRSTPWSGQVELRGLKPGRYRVVDYENGKPLGMVDASAPSLRVSFTEHLLLQTTPE